MRYKVLFALPALTEVRSGSYRRIKYARFPPLSLLTLAGLTPEDRYSMLVRDEHVEPVVVDEQVDLVAIQVYISSADRAYELAELYRRRGAKVVLGGLHASSLPLEAARHADAVCIGPAENVWPQILADFEAGRLRKFYRGASRGSAALVPLPRRELMNPRAYLVPNTMVTTRGCPHACAFCYKGAFWGERYYEARPIAEIERELASLDGPVVFFLDDNLLADRRHGRALFSLLRGSGIVWQAAASLDVVREPRYLDEAYAAGCRSLFVGFESLSPENMGRVNKQVNVVADYAEAVRRFHDAGIMVNGSFVFGFDCDGPDVFARTVDFAVASCIETATFHILTPFPGTPAFARLEREGRLLHRRWPLYDTDHAVFRPRRISPDQLERGHRRAYREFLRYGSILRRSFGLTAPLKRIAYNVGWMKVDPLWSAIIRLGLMPFARQIFARTLAVETRPLGGGTTAAGCVGSRGARRHLQRNATPLAS
jgi:radical SAM superfamily enzyme YgiQ (UPF0313 family)